MTSFSPREIVSELDRHIVGQRDAKRAVAIALAQPLAPPAARRGAARGGPAQEHPSLENIRCFLLNRKCRSSCLLTHG